MSNHVLTRIKEKGLEEGRRLLWIFLYLWAVLGLFSLYKSLILNEEHLFFHQGFAFFNAWLLAKVMLTADAFSVADNLRHKPLIYPILFRSAVFAALLMSFYFLEEFIVGMWRGKTLAESLPAIGDGTLRGTFVVGLIMFVVLTPFFALKEIFRDISGGKLFELFFLRRSKLIALS